MKDQNGSMQVSNVRCLEGLEVENGKLKRLLTKTMLDNTALKGLLAKSL